MESAVEYSNSDEWIVFLASENAEYHIQARIWDSIYPDFTRTLITQGQERKIKAINKSYPSPA